MQRALLRHAWLIRSDIVNLEHLDMVSVLGDEERLKDLNHSAALKAKIWQEVLEVDLAQLFFAYGVEGKDSLAPFLFLRVGKEADAVDGFCDSDVLLSRSFHRHQHFG